jgi:hypothetical protein
MLFLVTCAAAQRNPTMTSQMDDSDRERLYARFAENKKVPTSDRQQVAYEAAKEYLKRFDESTDRYIPEMRRFVTEYEKVMHQYDVYSAYNAKNYPKTFELGRSQLTRNAENFYVLSILSEAAFDESRQGKTTYDDEAIDYTRKAIAIIESDRLTSPDPFTNKEVGRNFLNFALGWFLRTKSPTEAAAALVIAAKTDGPYKTNALTYNLLGNTILKGEYAKLSSEYNEKFGNKPPSAEQQAMLEQIMKVGERAVDAYARAVALSTQPEQQEGRAKMLAQLTSLYKSFHNDSDAGLSELIATVLSKPLP